MTEISGISSKWLAFLTQHGAQLDQNAQEVLTFAGSPPEAVAESCSDFVAPLSDLGLIAVTGEDGPSFLHSQLTNDVEHLGQSEARLAGYCSPKGRLLATLMIWKSADTIFLQLPRTIQPAIQKRLQMYVLRAKAKLSDASEEQVILGLAGANVAQALGKWFSDLPSTPYAKIDAESGSLIRVADCQGSPRYQWIAPLSVAQAAWPILTQNLRPVGPALWRLTEIRAGMPRIDAATQEQFVPQMVNFEVIGGVNFKKGCYPGQEIVARSQYLGKLKRRMTLATVADGSARSGMEVFVDSDPDQPCGMLVNAEAWANGSHADCLVELKTAVLDQGSVHLGSATGPALQFQSLPYSLAATE